MKTRDSKLKTIARLVGSLEDELSVLESAQHIQFETTTSLKDKLMASKRARSALTKARRLSELISKKLVEPTE
jgi:hypothetical protein